MFNLGKIFALGIITNLDSFIREKLKLKHKITLVYIATGSKDRLLSRNLFLYNKEKWRVVKTGIEVCLVEIKPKKVFIEML